MLGTSLLVRSYVVINEGCPLAITQEGTDHVLIVCGGPPGDAFEIVVQYQALRALVELGIDALRQCHEDALRQCHERAVRTGGATVDRPHGDQAGYAGA
jgi:hypothetical protein